MAKHTSLTLFALVFLVNSSLQAGVVPGRWQKVDALEKGAELIVTMKSGDRIRCLFQGAGSTHLIVTDSDGQEQEIPKTEVAKIVHPSVKKDNAWNGAKIGAAIGVAGGVGAGVLLGRYWRHEEAVGVLIFAPSGAAGGLLAGYLVDKAYPGEEILYKAK